jgi:hypothetical protein
MTVKHQLGVLIRRIWPHSFPIHIFNSWALTQTTNTEGRSSTLSFRFPYQIRWLWEYLKPLSAQGVYNTFSSSFQSSWEGSPQDGTTKRMVNGIETLFRSKSNSFPFNDHTLFYKGNCCRGRACRRPGHDPTIEPSTMSEFLARTLLGNTPLALTDRLFTCPSGHIFECCGIATVVPIIRQNRGGLRYPYLSYHWFRSSARLTVRRTSWHISREPRWKA